MPERARLTLVTPSTKKATDSPNSDLISSRVNLVSSTASCRTPAMMVSSSIPQSSRIFLTARG